MWDIETSGSSGNFINSLRSRHILFMTANRALMENVIGLQNMLIRN